MNLPRLLRVVLCALGAGLAAIASAQSGATGTITGRVQNGINRQFVKNAQITVEGSNAQALTNDYGEFQLPGVPAGTATLRVTYSGLDTQRVTVAVTAGQTAQKDVTLTRRDVAAKDGEPVTLDAFVVASQRETNAAAIAVNEQRFATNIKNVVAVDAFGDVTEGNGAEFLKYLPGIAVNYVAADADQVAVRGFDPMFTGVSLDGARLATAANTNASRTVNFYTINTNNISRVEVTKVPTPDKPADSLGGSLNLVSRNAFEYTKPEFRYRAYLNLNNQYRNLSSTAGPGVGSTHKVLPGADFNYILPVSPTFGLVVNGLTSNQFNVQRRSDPGWVYSGGANVSQTNPYFRTYQVQDGPKVPQRDTLSVKADWKFAPQQVLSLTLQTNWYKAFFGNRYLNFDAGGNPTAFGPTFTQGATGAAAVSINANNFREFYNMVNSGVLGYRYNGRQWVVDAGLSFSEAQSWYRDRSRGHFYRLSTNMPGPLTMRIDDISYPKPGTFTVTNAAGAVVDYKSMDNYRLADTRSGPQDGKGLVPEAYANVQRHLDGLGFPLALKTGFDVRRETRDNRRTNDIWTFVGPDHVANSADDTISSLGLLDTNYLNQNNYWGWKNIQWPSAYKAFEMFKQHPDYFARQDVNSETNRITGSEWLRETVSATYLQAEAKFLQNRLRLVTGVRYEKTQDRGFGPFYDPNAIYQRTATGAFVRDAAGNRVRKVEAGAAGSLQELALLRQERGAKASRTYDGYYPSFHATYNVSDTTQVRFAYSLTLGRPELSNIIPNATINENASYTGAAGTTPGTITVTNTGLKPWETKNYDLSLEHYFAGGGMASAGVFRKSISDFWGNVNTPLTPALANELGISSEYNGWNVISKVNTGSARVDGVELNYQQPLKFAFLPDWARRFSVNANATQLHLMGSNDADFGNFIARTRNLGLTYSDKRAVVMLKWNFRGRQKQGLQSGIGPDAYNYYNPRSNVDVNAEYALTKHLSVFGNARNIFNVAQDQDAYGKNTPAYSRWAFTEEFGVQMAFGIKGSF